MLTQTLLEQWEEIIGQKISVLYNYIKIMRSSMHGLYQWSCKRYKSLTEKKNFYNDQTLICLRKKFLKYNGLELCLRFKFILRFLLTKDYDDESWET